MPNKNKRQRTTARELSSQKDAKPEKPVVATFYERWDVQMFNSILELVLPREIEEMLEDKLRYEVNNTSFSYRKVEYHIGEFAKGRIYGTGLQSVPKWVRRLCAHQYYIDIDIVNCGPTLFSQLLAKNNVPVPPLLQQYADDRKAMYNLIRQFEPNFTEGVMKDLLLQISHMGPSPQIGPLESLRSQTRQASMELATRPKYAIMYREVENERNPLGSFIGRVWQEVEHKVLMTMIDYYTMKGKTVGAPVFDGFLLEKCDDPDLVGAEEAVYQQTGYRIKLVQKPMTPTKEDHALLWGERALNKIATPFMRQIYLLYRHAQLAGLKRQAGYVVEPHPTIPGVFVRGDDVETYINRVLLDVHTGGEVSMKKLSDWFYNIDHSMFELLTPSKMSRHIISFINGYMDINALCFVEWGSNEHVPITDHYFEQTLDMEEAAQAATPLWDSLTTTQLGKRNICKVAQCGRSSVFADDTCDLHVEDASVGFITPSVADMLEVMIGRCFYPIGTYDNWQVNLFMKGDANTGKGTICDLIKHMFADGATGTITATHEQNFGLEALYQKRLVLVPDLPKYFSKIVNQSDFQSMCSGESVSIARKNKTAVTNQNWTVPLVFAANYLPDYNDNSGSVSRRLVVFLFNQLIESRNTMLKHDIIKHELVTVIVRCITAYRRLVAQKPTADFWTKIAPRALQEIQSETKAETNPLANFLRNGDSYYQIIRDDTGITALSDLEKAYSNHMRIWHKVEKAKLGYDYHPIRSEGYKIECVNLCKECHNKSSKAVCGSHYNKANRYKKVVVSGMTIRSRAAGFV